MNTDFTSEEKILIKRDKVLSNVIKTNGPIKFSNNRKDPFDTFVDIIIHNLSRPWLPRVLKKKCWKILTKKNLK